MIEFSAYEHDGEPRDLLGGERWHVRVGWLGFGIALALPLWLGMCAARWVLG